MICLAAYEPRPYQTKCVEALLKAEADGCAKGLVVMASGLGKTLTAAFYLQRILQEQPDARVLVLCHQEEILLQSKEKFRNFFGDEYSYGMFTGTYKTRRAVSFLFSTFQTMRDYRTQFAEDTFAYVIVDEAHHTPAGTYQPTVDYFTPRFLLGLTATKDRSDGQDLLDTYERIIYSMDIFDGWAEGWLAPVDYRIMLDDLSKEEFEKYVGPQAGNEKVSLAQLNRTIFAPRRDEEIVKSIREQIADMDNPSMFVFCAGIDHAKAMAHQFGGEAAVVHSGQSRDTNRTALEAFRTGDIRVIISVDMLNEGIDVPETSVVVFLRNTSVQTVFWQQLGRGLRISGEKRTVRVLDYVANLERISTVLEMEITTKKRIEANPIYPPSVNKSEPMVVSIPVTNFKVEKVDIKSIFERIRRKATKEEVIRVIQEYATTHNLTRLCHSDVRPLFAIDTLKRLFGGGGFDKAVEAAGFEYYHIPNVWTKDLIVQVFRENAIDGKMPTPLEVVKNPDYPSPSTIWRHFPDWETLAATAELTMNTELTAEDMLKAYLEASLAAGKWLSGLEINAHSELQSCTVYRRRLGYVSSLPDLATKLDPDRVERANLKPAIGLYSPQNIKVKIQDFIRIHHRLPTTVDFGPGTSLPSFQVCYKRCKVRTLPELLEKCQAQQVLDEVGELPKEVAPLISEDEIVALRQLAIRLGRRLKARDLRPQNGTKCYAYFRQHDINIEEVNSLAGIDESLLERVKTEK